MEKLKAYLARIFPLPEKDWEALAGKLVRREYTRKALVLEAGQVEDHISFIGQGNIRFFIPGTETEKTFAFIFEGELVCAYDSFLTRFPVEYHVQALNPTILWSISFDDLQRFYRENPASNALGRILSEEIYLKKAKRELSFLKESAEQRYLRIFSERPNLLEQIPLKYIASYIGVTPQALSRIRRRIS